MENSISGVCDELRTVGEEAQQAFGRLSAEQLNWKPAAKSWSVAQCFDHLITTHSLYFPLLEKMATGEVRPTFWQKVSPLSGFFGRFLKNGVDPANVKPMLTTSKAFPSSSEISGDIIERFGQHQRDMAEHLERLPEDIDRKTIITSPLLGFVTYSIDDMLTILGYHCRRHFNQAKRVVETPGFPSQ